jgi:hypothetical protein
MTTPSDKELDTLYVNFVSHFLGHHNSATPYDINQCGCATNFMNDAQQQLLNELLEQQESYITDTFPSSERVGVWAVPVETIAKYLDKEDV